jgi:hypothetical protein
MKTPLTFLLVLIVTATFAQTIRRVNNNPAVTGSNIYATLQAAHDAATNGDIIYVEGSVAPYGNLTCIKSLTLIGTGYYLNPNTPASVIGAVTFKAGSQNSVLTGFTLSTISVQGVSNITLARNASLASIGNITIDTQDALTAIFSSISNVNVLGNYNFNLSLVPRTSGALNYTISNVVIRGNLMDALSYGSTPSLVSSAIVANNIIFRITSIIHNSSIQNNISHGSFGVASFVNCSVANNVAFGSLWPTGNNNKSNIADPFVQVNPPVDTGWQLKPGSAASGAGVGGTDCGVFGGDTPYVLSGIPNYPTITNFITSGTGSAATPLSVTISTKSNN